MEKINNDVSIRRTPSELLTRYLLEPTLRDVYVEGSSDVTLFNWFFKELGIRNAVSYEIATVQIDKGETDAIGLANNNRGRVIALSILASENLTQPSPQITCVVDSDFDFVQGFTIANDVLVYTDYACMEMYAFNPVVFEKFLTLFIGGFSEEATSVLIKLSNVLVETFCIRAAREELHPDSERYAFGRCYSISRRTLKFDRKQYVERYLNSIAKKHDLDALNATIDKYLSLKQQDSRMNMHGHDFIDLLRWYLANNGINNKFASEDILLRVLYCCLDASALRTVQNLHDIK